MIGATLAGDGTAAQIGLAATGAVITSAGASADRYGRLAVTRLIRQPHHHEKGNARWHMSSHPSAWINDHPPWRYAVSMRTKSKDTVHKVSTGIHRSIFRVSKGRVLGRVLGMPVVELVTIGRKSGKERATMLAAPIAEPDRIVLVASFGGDDRHPAWYLNLRVNPRVRATTAGRARTMVARTATDDERAALWPQITATCHNYADYQERTNRPIPVVILEPA